MSMTDPIADLLTRIRNGHMAGHRSVSVPGSKMKAEIVRIMKDEGYIGEFVVEELAPQNVIRGALRGIAKRRLHIFPTFETRLMGFISRVFPGLMRLMLRVLVRIVD